MPNSKGGWKTGPLLSVIHSSKDTDRQQVESKDIWHACDGPW